MIKIGFKFGRIGIRPDRDERWSPPARNYFQLLTRTNQSNLFEAHMKTFDAKADAFKIDLLYDNLSINQELVKAGFAISL